ncbi:hypothetical protein ACVILH_006412 [Bradyrhizobium sp. USDA 4353]
MRVNLVLRPSRFALKTLAGIRRLITRLSLSNGLRCSNRKKLQLGGQYVAALASTAVSPVEQTYAEVRDKGGVLRKKFGLVCPDFGSGDIFWLRAGAVLDDCNVCSGRSQGSATQLRFGRKPVQSKPVPVIGQQVCAS